MDQKLWILILRGLFPSAHPCPSEALVSLAEHIDRANQRSCKMAILRDILDRYKDVHLIDKACAIRFLGSDRKAEVRMVSSSLGVLDSVNGVAREASGEHVPPNEEEPRNTEELAESKSRYAMKGILDEPFRHWMIDIPDRRMAWHLTRKAESEKITIEQKDLVQELTTAALGVKLTNIKSRPWGLQMSAICSSMR